MLRVAEPVGQTPWWGTAPSWDSHLRGEGLGFTQDRHSSAHQAFVAVKSVAIKGNTCDTFGTQTCHVVKRIPHSILYTVKPQHECLEVDRARQVDDVVLLCRPQAPEVLRP